MQANGGHLMIIEPGGRNGHGELHFNMTGYTGVYPMRLAFHALSVSRSVISAAMLLAVVAWPPSFAAERSPTRLPEGVLPTIGLWCFTDVEFQPGAYRSSLDTLARHANYNLLTTTIRAPNKEVTDKAVHDQIREATLYSRRLGMKIAMDLDVRLARAAFQKAHPDEMQEMLRLREISLPDTGEAVVKIASEHLSDHYTYRATPYIALSGRLVRVYSYLRGPEGIELDSLQDITTQCAAKTAGAKEVAVAVPCGPQTKGRRACAIVAFTHFTPDVFAPHLLEFQRAILAKYADVPLAGACKDEWGFPPCYDGCPAKNDYWYSRWLEAAYAERTGGRELVRDALLMTFGERGRQDQRQAAINQFMDLCRWRNAAIEDDFYRATKAVFGPSAVVATHPTWWPYPGTNEFKKNGLDWWQATRDLAQVDEITPFCVRTALAKKWGSPVWYNMFYDRTVAAYERSVWSHALGGGRINYHPVYPLPGPKGSSQELLLQGGLTRADCRVRLLNFIVKSPIDCPVAVVFGHACAMNWAGPAYDDVGMSLADRLWRAGSYADLVPSSEIAGGSLQVDPDGTVRYGPQRYAAVVLYHPEFERRLTAEFFRRAASARTALFRVGTWTRGFDGKAFDGNAALPPAMAAIEAGACADRVIARLREQGIVPQEPAVDTAGWGSRIAAPPPKGRCRLLDGTQIVLAGEKDVTGDPIRTTLTIGRHEAMFDCLGVAAVRLADDGSLAAMAAGSLKHFRAGRVEIALDKPIDVALWRDAEGKFHGALQDWADPVPAPLLALTSDWLRLSVPPPLLRGRD
jgi:hypothetical protein